MWTVRLLCTIKEKKIGNFGRFFGDFSVFGGSGKKNPCKKSTEKISAKNRKIPIFSRKNPIFPEKNRIFPEIWDKLSFRSLRRKKLKTGAKQSCRIKKKCTLGKNNSYLMH